MDISFDIHNEKGDQLRVALSYYDAENVSIFTDDPLTLSLTFYDVTLMRMAGNHRLDYKTLNAVSGILARFLDDNPEAILCFYCDDMTDVERNDINITPQEFRSRLFSRMFERYTKTHDVTIYVNHRIKIVSDNKPRFAHFICRREYLASVELIGSILMNK